MLTRKEQNAKRLEELKAKLHVGAFVKNVWGSTMQRVSYYEVVAINGKVVELAHAKISGDPSPNCSFSTVTLLGASEFKQPVKRAIIRNGYLVKEGDSLSSYWSTYTIVNVGDKTDTWSD